MITVEVTVTGPLGGAVTVTSEINPPAVRFWAWQELSCAAPEIERIARHVDSLAARAAQAGRATS